MNIRMRTRIPHLQNPCPSQMGAQADIGITAGTHIIVHEKGKDSIHAQYIQPVCIRDVKISILKYGKTLILVVEKI